MLIFILPTISLLSLPKITPSSWYLITPLLIFLTYTRIIKTIQYSSYLYESPLIRIDILSGSLIMLAYWISGLILLARSSIKNNNRKPSLFILMVISLLIILIRCFSTSNTIYFYILFEASLIPTILLIILWGYQPERIQARMYLIIYTVTASLPLLIIVILLIRASKHQSIRYPFIPLPETTNPYPIYFMLSFAFIVKLPLFLVHLWLPKAHVEAPVAGSIILAAILLKLGGYGLMRVSALFTELTTSLSPPVIRTALIGAISTSLICLRQTDLKSIIAYSSIGHIGLICLGVFSGFNIGFNGAIMIIIAHAFSSSALFCICNIIYESTHTRNLRLTKGILLYNPTISIWWFLLICINIAAPPSINLVREILLISSSVAYSIISILPIILIRFINVAYSLFLYSRINHGHILNQINPILGLPISYNLLILIHLLPGVILIICPNLLIII